MMKKLSPFIILLIAVMQLSAQSKKELKNQNEDLKKQYDELHALKRSLDLEKTWLKEETSRLYEENLRKQNLITKTRSELKQRGDSLSDIRKLKEMSEYELLHQRLLSQNQILKIEQQRLEAEKQKSAQMVLLISLAFILSVAGLLFYLWISRRKAGTILEIEKKKSDDLLLNILPHEIAEELKRNNGKTTAKSYSMVTVLFADIKNFTQISEHLSPVTLIEELDFIFGAFDAIIEKHDIEKIKVIGDAYMCAGGIPVANTTNPVDIVNAAIEMQAFMYKTMIDRKTQKQVFMELRIGIHTGSVVAGVVGTKKFTYDIWGDAVNIASRLESAGEAGKINISKTTYEIVKNDFNCISRGMIEAKNKGMIEMFFVE